MRSLLLVAHGSRLDASNEEIRRMTDRLRERVGANYGFVNCAYLELAKPDIPEGIEACVAAGAREVYIVPYFLAAGRHIREDIPAEIAKANHAGVRVELCDYIGLAKGMPDLLMSMVPYTDNR